MTVDSGPLLLGQPKGGLSLLKVIGIEITLLEKQAGVRELHQQVDRVGVESLTNTLRIH